MSKLGAAVKLSCVIGCLLFGATLLVISWQGKGYKALSVQTGSMRPGLEPGDLVLTRYVPISDLKKGDIVTYLAKPGSAATLTHRVVEVKATAAGQRSLITKGDANAAADPPVYSNQIIGATALSLPLLGTVADMIRSLWGLVALVYIPALAIISVELRRLSWYYARQAALSLQATTRQLRGIKAVLITRLIAAYLALQSGWLHRLHLKPIPLPLHADISTVPLSSTTPRAD